LPGHADLNGRLPALKAPALRDNSRIARRNSNMGDFKSHPISPLKFKSFFPKRVIMVGKVSVQS
jgi:hypothetical protein